MMMKPTIVLNFARFRLTFVNDVVCVPKPPLITSRSPIRNFWFLFFLKGADRSIRTDSEVESDLMRLASTVPFILAAVFKIS